MEASKDTIKQFDVNLSDQKAMDYVADWNVTSAKQGIGKTTWNY